MLHKSYLEQASRSVGGQVSCRIPIYISTYLQYLHIYISTTRTWRVCSSSVRWWWGDVPSLWWPQLPGAPPTIHTSSAPPGTRHPPAYYQHIVWENSLTGHRVSRRLKGINSIPTAAGKDVCLMTRYHIIIFTVSCSSSSPPPGPPPSLITSHHTDTATATSPAHYTGQEIVDSPVSIIYQE